MFYLCHILAFCYVSDCFNISLTITTNKCTNTIAKIKKGLKKLLVLVCSSTITIAIIVIIIFHTKLSAIYKRYH